ncbi:MAG: HAMP domain-containing histidine kinase, partial [Bifidobacteriaceae bacterium]|nr:HAMP domain-containing histidine kinase [Bifidobacteriaceae bacterium]
MVLPRPAAWPRRAWAALMGPAVDLRAQAFTVAALAGIAISLVTAFVNAVGGMGAASTALNLAAGGAAAALLAFTRRTGRYRLAYVITAVAVFLVVFPLLFFSGGGLGAGMPAFFVFAIAFTAFMLDGAPLWILVGLEVAVYTACCLAAQYRPAWVTPLAGRAAMWDSIYSVVAAGVTLAAVFHALLRVYGRARAQLGRRNAQLAASAEAKSRFLATAAHELNTPLALIQLHAEETLSDAVRPLRANLPVPGNGAAGVAAGGAADLAVGGAADITGGREADVAAGSAADVAAGEADCAEGGERAEGGQLRHNLEVIAAEAARLGRLVDELLDLARIEDGRMAFDIRPEPLGALIQDTLAAYLPLAAAAGATIAVGRDAPNPVVLADRGRIAQVLVNLLANAVRHAPGGTVSVDVAADSAHAEVSVADT